MVVYSFYIFDRHAECIYRRRWLPRPASIVGKSSRPTSDTPTLSNGISPALEKLGRTADDDAKLVFGTVFSLRNMVRKLGGDDDSFISYTTNQYKLHFYETPTNTKFVMITDIKSPSMRIALQQIYINLYVEYGRWRRCYILRTDDFHQQRLTRFSSIFDSCQKPTISR
ncbi:hypothetical protein MAP00_007002 [Monascus purpureus]|nr:hypothetical protein MAP00_007002 [Monascus purpureus]